MGAPKNHLHVFLVTVYISYKPYKWSYFNLLITYNLGFVGPPCIGINLQFSVTFRQPTWALHGTSFEGCQRGQRIHTDAWTSGMFSGGWANPFEKYYTPEI